MDAVTAAPARPRDVVFAGVLTIMGSALALAGIFSLQGQLRTSSFRREVESRLSTEQFSSVDLSVETVLNVFEVGLMAAAAASVAAIVFAVFVMRGHNASRISLSVLGGLAAAVSLLSGLAGIAVAVFVAYTVSLLWRQPVRTWFAEVSGSGGGSGEPDATEAAGAFGGSAAGRPHDEPAPGRGPEPVSPPAGSPPLGQDSGAGDRPGPYPHPWPPGPASGEEPGRQPEEQPEQEPGPWRPEWSQQPPRGGGTPGPSEPWPPQGPWPQPGRQSGAEPGQQPGAPGYPGQYPPAYGYGYPSGYYGYGYPPADASRRPAQVVAAHVMTWVGVAFGVVTGLFFVLAAGSQEIIEVVREQLTADDVTTGEFVSMLRMAGVLTLLWSLAVGVASVFSWRQRNWAAVLLAVMGGGYLLVQLFTLVMGQPAVLFTIVWVAAVLVLLWWPSSRQWYAAGRQGGPGAPGGPPGGSPYRRPRNQPW